MHDPYDDSLEFDPVRPTEQDGDEFIEPTISGGDEAMQEAALAALRSIFDPEIPINIYELGLIYAVELQEGGPATVTMTLTSPGCPAAIVLPGEVEEKINALPGVTEAIVNVVWEPPWTPARMSEVARLELGMY
jgi:FeS assembly SUF system protein